MTANDYSAKHIEVLEGLEPVRVRPGMYIGGTDLTGLHHLVWEAMDNAVDEAINGYCQHIVVTVKADGSISVEDDGRGIPVDNHPKFNRPALEIIMTTLHSGAKFSNKSYSASGGLHGVGISVVNALSEHLDVTVCKDGYEWNQQFSRGKPLGKLKRVGDTRKKGSKITFKPDPQIFSKTTFSKKLIADRAETKAFLNSGLTITVVDERDNTSEKFHYENGIRDFLKKLLEGRKPIGSNYFYHNQKNGMQIEVALQWTENTENVVYSYANSVFTSDGGTHEAGLRNALTKILRSHIERTAPKGKAPAITTDDVREGLTAVISIFLSNPQFQGQTKEKLNNPEAQAAVEAMVRTAFERYLLENPSSAESIISRVILAAQARMASRSAKEAVMRKTPISHRLTLPGKLADCSSTDPAMCELFLVEGDSAGGSSKQARDRRIQAVLPLRGKILNVENATPEKLANNNEIKALTTTIGAGIGDSFDYSKLRYEKIIIMTDADVDGAHISALLLTFFYRYMPQLIDKGNVYLAQPPLYRIELGKTVKYAQDDEEKATILIMAPKNVKPELHRYKGLGEMPMQILKETTMDPNRRKLLKVSIQDAETVEDTVTRLMGKDASARYDFIKENSAAFVNAGGELDI
ncbi:MAG: DNA gyrase subunit B [Nitrospinae bacterium]|nr:DNA gyrase subunit B [Nitrospinota bacterium]